MRDLMISTGAKVYSEPVKTADGNIQIILMQGMPQNAKSGQKKAWGDLVPCYLTAIFPSAWENYLSQMASVRASKSLKGAWVDISGPVTFTATPDNNVSILIEPLSFDFSSNERHEVDDTSCTEETFKYHGGLFSFNMFRLRIFSDRTLDSVRAAAQANAETPPYLTFDSAHDRVQGVESNIQVSYHLLFGSKNVRQADRCLYGGSHIDAITTLSAINARQKDGKTYVNVYMTVDKFQLSPSISSSERAASKASTAAAAAPAPVAEAEQPIF